MHEFRSMCGWGGCWYAHLCSDFLLKACHIPLVLLAQTLQQRLFLHVPIQCRVPALSGAATRHAPPSQTFAQASLETPRRAGPSGFCWLAETLGQR